MAENIWLNAKQVGVAIAVVKNDLEAPQLLSPWFVLCKNFIKGDIAFSHQESGTSWVPYLSAVKMAFEKVPFFACANVGAQSKARTRHLHTSSVSNGKDHVLPIRAAVF